MRTSYSNVKLPPNTIAGATVTALTSKEGVTLTRVTADGRDDLVVVRKGRTMVIPWAQTKGGIEAPAVAAVSGSYADRIAEKRMMAELQAAGMEPFDDVPIDDSVRVTKKRGPRSKAAE